MLFKCSPFSPSFSHIKSERFVFSPVYKLHWHTLQLHGSGISASCSFSCLHITEYGTFSSHWLIPTYMVLICVSHIYVCIRVCVFFCPCLHNCRFAHSTYRFISHALRLSQTQMEDGFSAVGRTTITHLFLSLFPPAPCTMASLHSVVHHTASVQQI